MGVGYTTILYDERALGTGFADIGACRYDGVEVGLPKLQGVGADRVETWLDTHDLDLYCVMSPWLESDAAVRRVVAAVETVAGLGADHLGLLPPQRHRVDAATVDPWLERVCDAAVDHGLDPVLHHHGGTVAERPAEIRRFLDAHEALGLLFDTAHWYPYGDHFPDGDVTDGVERFADDVAYVHLKDVAPPASFAEVRDALSAPEPSLDAVVDYFRAFTDLGEGVLDLPGCLAALDAAGYDGHYTVEIENERERPLVHAKQNIDTWRGYVADGSG